MAVANTLYVFYAVLIGGAVGSFLNLSIDRLPLGLSLFAPASRCDGCQRPIPFRHLVPVVSFFWLRGQCPNCHAGIPLRTALIEGATMCLFGLAVWHYGLSVTAGIIASFAALFLVVAFIDLERGLILNNVVLLGTLASFLIFPFGPVGEAYGIGQAYLWSLMGGLVGFLALLILYVSFPGGIGAGDVKLAGLIGTSLGLQLLATGLLLAFAVGSMVAILLLASRLRTRKDALPFGPFLVGAAMVAMVAGRQIQDWYLHLIL